MSAAAGQKPEIDTRLELALSFGQAGAAAMRWDAAGRKSHRLPGCVESAKELQGKYYVATLLEP